MIKLTDRSIDECGNVILSEEGLCNVLMSGNSINSLTVESSKSVLQFNELCKQLDMPEEVLTLYDPMQSNIEAYHALRTDDWFMPESYKNLDIIKYLINLCSNDIEISRINYELKLFQKYKLFDMLKFLVYLVDYMRTNKILWGLGRGSSVASYCLFLIGIHKIDSLKFNLDIHEFLK